MSLCGGMRTVVSCRSSKNPKKTKTRVGVKTDLAVWICTPSLHRRSASHWVCNAQSSIVGAIIKKIG